MDAVQVMLQTMLQGGKAPRPELQAKKESGNAGSSEGTNSRSCAEPRPEVVQTAPVPSVRKGGPATMASSRGTKQALGGGMEPEGSTGRAVPGSSGAGSRSQEPEERLDQLEGDLQQRKTAVPGMRQAWRGRPRAPAGAAAEGGVETMLAKVDRLHSEIQGRAPSRNDPEGLVKWSWLPETVGDVGDQGKQETRAPIPATVDLNEVAPEVRRRSQRRTIEVRDAQQTAGTCYWCGGKGHRMVQCPSRQGVLASCTEDGGRRFLAIPTNPGKRQQLVEWRAAEPASSQGSPAPQGGESEPAEGDSRQC
ncbi:uncharacterized protein PHA67_001565 [Liasis olivaceus]